MGIFSSEKERLGIAVVGLGYISQQAVLPAFEKTTNCRIAALVSGDGAKLRKLGKIYEVDALYSYEDYDLCLKDPEVDAVYIGLPNSMHRDFVLKAAEHGKHVLCEKPMAMNSSDCIAMIEACQAAGVKLMVAYRLHFEEVNMKAVEAIRRGEIGEVRMLTAAFGQQVKDGDIRTDAELGGGALFDMGIYCLNAARYFFNGEPTKVQAIISNPPGDRRFDSVDGLAGVLLEFGTGRIATFLTSLACAEVSSCIVIGEKGVIKLDPAFDFQLKLESEIVVDGEVHDNLKARSDQFAGELTRFAEFVITDTEVEPDGYEGLADVRVLEAIFESAREGRSVTIENRGIATPVDPTKLMRKKYTSPPQLVRASAPGNN